MFSPTKKQSPFQPERFQDGPQFALILNQELSQIQISTIQKQLCNQGLIVLQTQSLDRKKNILFIELSNIYAVFQEAQELQIKKNFKQSKSSILEYQSAEQHPQQQQLSSLGTFNNINNNYHNNNNNNMADQSNNQSSPNQNLIKLKQYQINEQQKQQLLTENSYHSLGQPVQSFDLNSHFSFNNASFQSPKRKQSQNPIFRFDQFSNNQVNPEESKHNSPSTNEPLNLLNMIDNNKKQLNGGSSNRFSVRVSQKQGKQILQEIDPRILKYERLNIINLAMLYESSTNGNKKLINIGLGLFSPSERLRITYSFMNKICIQDLRFLEYLQEQEIVTEIIPLHEKTAAINDSIQSIEDYYGENISTYFEFLDCYQKWLLYPAIFGLLSFLLSNKFPNWQFQLYFIYSVFVCIWTTLFYIHWKRYESELQVKWGVFAKKIYKEDRNVNFKGIKRIKCTTMCEEEYYPKSKRFYYYLISGMESLPLLVLAFCLKIIIFNLNGLISSNKSIFYIEQIASLTQAGGILNKLPLKETLLNVIMIVVIIKINEIYNIISSRSTKRENHRTNIDFNSSLVIKRFIFDLINRFTHFFFIAFVIRDIVSLKSLLGSLFMMDEIRKIATESVIPWAMKKFLSTKTQSESNGEDETIKKNEELNLLYSDSIREVDMWPYDDFDDYIEVVAQLAFITLFAAVTPIAAFLCYLFNIFERQSDKFKLQQRLYRRPLPFKVQGIGAWNKVVFLISIICTFTNVAFLAFEHYDIYQINVPQEEQVCTEALNDNSTHFGTNVNSFTNGAQQSIYQLDLVWMNVYIYMFTLEHIILLAIMILHYFISYQPKWVRIYKRRMQNNNTSYP